MNPEEQRAASEVRLEQEIARRRPAASTRKACAEPAGVMEQEAQFLKALETAATYRIQGTRLELGKSDGALAVQFIKGALTDK